MSTLTLACGGGDSPTAPGSAGAGGVRGEAGARSGAETAGAGGARKSTAHRSEAGSSGDEPCALGEEGCDCFPNKTCYGTLSCFSMLCVDASGLAAGSGTIDRGGAGGFAEDGNAGGVGARQDAASGASSYTEGGAPSGAAGAGGNQGGGTGGNSAGSRPVDIHGALSVEGTSLIDVHGDPVRLQGLSGYWTNWQDWHPEQNAAATADALSLQKLT